MTDHTVLALHIAGLAATVAGTGIGGVDVARRIRRYRGAVQSAPPAADWAEGLDSIQRRHAAMDPGIVRSQAERAIKAERAARELSETRLAALFGTTVLPLLFAVGLVLLGAVLSGIGDVVVTVRRP